MFGFWRAKPNINKSENAVTAGRYVAGNALHNRIRKPRSNYTWHIVEAKTLTYASQSCFGHTATANTNKLDRWNKRCAMCEFDAVEFAFSERVRPIRPSLRELQIHTKISGEQTNETYIFIC